MIVVLATRRDGNVVRIPCSGLAEAQRFATSIAESCRDVEIFFSERWL